MLTRRKIRAHIAPEDRVLNIGRHNRFLANYCADILTLDPRPGITGKGVTFASVEPLQGVPQVNLGAVIEGFRPTVIVRDGEIERVHDNVAPYSREK